MISMWISDESSDMLASPSTWMIGYPVCPQQVYMYVSEMCGGFLDEVEILGKASHVFR